MIVLPKELVEYILSIVIFDFYSDLYTDGEESYCESIKSMCQQNTNMFYIKHSISPMSKLMSSLSLIHPKIRQMLKNKCVFYFHVKKMWNFKRTFFSSIVQHNQ